MPPWITAVAIVIISGGALCDVFAPVEGRRSTLVANALFLLSFATVYSPLFLFWARGESWPRLVAFVVPLLTGTACALAALRGRPSLRDLKPSGWRDRLFAALGAVVIALSVVMAVVRSLLTA